MGLWADAKNIRDKDPAARNVAEVIILYPGFHVLVTHKIAHFLYCHKCFFLARLISQLARHLTGIEIHPGARSATGCSLTTVWASCSAKRQKSVITAPSTTALPWAAPARIPASATPHWAITC